MVVACGLRLLSVCLHGGGPSFTVDGLGCFGDRVSFSLTVGSFWSADSITPGYPCCGRYLGFSSISGGCPPLVGFSLVSTGTPSGGSGTEGPLLFWPIASLAVFWEHEGIGNTSSMPLLLSFPSRPGPQGVCAPGSLTTAAPALGFWEERGLSVCLDFGGPGSGPGRDLWLLLSLCIAAGLGGSWRPGLGSAAQGLLPSSLPEERLGEPQRCRAARLGSSLVIGWG